jgi:hypothetical protein
VLVYFALGKRQPPLPDKKRASIPWPRTRAAQVCEVTAKAYSIERVVEKHSERLIEQIGAWGTFASGSAQAPSSSYAAVDIRLKRSFANTAKSARLLSSLQHQPSRTPWGPRR